MIEVLIDGVNSKPIKTLPHFEKAALFLLHDKLSCAEISCYYFHLTQCFKRKIDETGLKRSYENFREFNLALQRLPAFADVPLVDRKVTFELGIDEITDVIGREQLQESGVCKLDELANCLWSSHIEKPIAKKLPFPIEMWNQCDAAGEGVDRATNSVGEWRYGLQALLSGSTPIT